jgi:hypothetical protein
MCVNAFVRGLPPVPAFNLLRAKLPRRLDAITRDDDYGAFVGISEEVLELDNVFRPPPHLQPARPSRVPSSSAPPPVIFPPASTSTSDPSRVPKKDQSCSNCKSRGLRGVGHTDGTCFQPGGGMEGCREEYMANRGRVHAMFVECLENAFSIPDEALPPDLSSSSPTSPVMRLNMAEREPQNKLTVFEGFMSGLITMVKLPEMCQHDERRKDTKPAS